MRFVRYAIGSERVVEFRLGKFIVHIATSDVMGRRLISLWWGWRLFFQTSRPRPIVSSTFTDDEWEVVRDCGF